MSLLLIVASKKVKKLHRTKWCVFCGRPCTLNFCLNLNSILLWYSFLSLDPLRAYFLFAEQWCAISKAHLQGLKKELLRPFQILAIFNEPCYYHSIVQSTKYGLLGCKDLTITAITTFSSIFQWFLMFFKENTPKIELQIAALKPNFKIFIWVMIL